MGWSWFSCHKSGGEPSEVDGEIAAIDNVKIYKYKEIRQATDDFNALNKIGEGGFGSVYKGRLKDGKIAAIKVLSAESRQGAKEFLTEINVISKIQHDNLVKLYGCCVEGNHRILVYNYLENNSLDKTLLGDSHSFFFVTLVSVSFSGGYLAPEYAVRGQLTRKADIYSFGVLLMEIVSGRSNKNTRLPTEYQYLLERAWELYERNELVDLVDTGLNGDFDAEEACRYLKIGLLCTQDSPKLRPTMSTVVRFLTGEKDIDYKKISRPGLISDFMDLKVRGPVQTKPEEVNRHNYTNPSSSNTSSSAGTRDNSNAYSSGASSANAGNTFSSTI
ncbi:unnamed protein product [Thlaspi arvense]|uniref:Protein kinase domain-containing protein n=1 Tax=Thlaspi arvense TaxID=13288 RepID=A0AAU9RFU5_THLAR|nr:unnamed protein product [Thlaspi arvense]